MLQAKNISKSYAKQEVLRNVSLNIRPGQITALIGHSGAGKTTLLKALSLVEPPDKGKIILEDDVYEFPSSENADQNNFPKPWPLVTVVFQKLFLWPHLTLRENILLPARNVWQADAQDQLLQQLDKLARHFETRDFLDRFPNEVSLGQCQRVAIMRAVLLKAKYILMDEITSALDVQQISRIIEHLPKLKEQNIGLLLVTHLIHFAGRIADQVIFLEKGKIVEKGGAFILKKPQTKNLKNFLAILEEAS